MTVEPFVHPTTYAFMEATEENLAAAVEDGFVEVAKHKREIADLRSRMAPLMERLAEMRGPAKLPPRTRRSRTQELVGFCPRCSGRLDGAA